MTNVMKKIALMAVTLVTASFVANAQDNLLWFNLGNQVGPDNVTDLDGTPGTNYASGALVQLIRTTDGSASAPDYSSPLAGGVTGDDRLTSYSSPDGAQSWVGKGGTGDGIFADTALFSTLGIGQTSNIYVRIFDRPASDSSASLPTAMVYVDPLVLANYPGAAGQAGVFYHDYAVQAAGAVTSGGGLFEYQAPVFDGSSGWTFLAAPAVPEPGTFGLMLLGLAGVSAARKRRK